MEWTATRSEEKPVNFKAIEAAWTPRVLSVLRITSALIFTLHGSQKLLSFPEAKFQPEILSLMGIGGLLELVGGLMLLAGFYNNLFPTLNGGDAAILYCFVFLYLVFAGGGSWSIDALRARIRNREIPNAFEEALAREAAVIKPD
jgi:putative oxidoreductase